MSDGICWERAAGIPAGCGGVTVCIRLVSCSYEVINESDVALHCPTAERMGVMWPSGVRRANPPGNQLLLYKRGFPYWGLQIDMLELSKIFIQSALHFSLIEEGSKILVVSQH